MVRELNWNGTPEERFWRYTDKNYICLCDYCQNHSGYCWRWIGAPDQDGYGLLSITISPYNHKNIRAHRFAYELVKGKIPDKLTLDHLCRNRWCVNPDHLEPVTDKQNILRGVGLAAQNVKKTHCPRGHEYSGDNLYMFDNRRHCRPCATLRMREFRERKNRKEYL